MRNYIKSFNWTAWSFVMVLICLAALTNDNVNDFYTWLGIVIVLGLPLSLFPLIAGRKQN